MFQFNRGGVRRKVRLGRIRLVVMLKKDVRAKHKSSQLVRVLQYQYDAPKLFNSQRLLSENSYKEKTNFLSQKIFYSYSIIDEGYTTAK